MDVYCTVDYFPVGREVLVDRGCDPTREAQAESSEPESEDQAWRQDVHSSSGHAG